MLEYVYRAPVLHSRPLSAYWMLLAVHGMTENLIGGLPAADAADLYAAYTRAYPRGKRLPVQTRVLKKLRLTGGIPRRLFR